MSKVIRAVFDFALHVMRRATPFFICLFGMSAPVVLSPSNVWFGMFIAGAAFAWALDMAETRAAAEAKSDTAAKFIAFMTTGEDRYIDIKVFRQTSALNEEG